MNMYKLLIVDDNQIQIQSLLEFIDWKKFGITEIVTAYNGEEGLAAYKKTKPDIIITDVVMPITVSYTHLVFIYLDIKQNRHCLNKFILPGTQFHSLRA